MPMGTTMALSSSMRRPRPSMPRWYSTLRGGDPGVALLELECAGGAVEVEPEDESEREGGEAEGEGGPAGEILVAAESQER